MAGERDTDERDMECEWCGHKFDPDKEDCWDDGNEHYFCSEMCLGQFEAEGAAMSKAAGEGKRTREHELIGILRFFIYHTPKRSDRWIKQRSLYDALKKLMDKELTR